MSCSTHSITKFLHAMLRILCQCLHCKRHMDTGPLMAACGLQLVTEVSLQILIWGSVATAFSQVGELAAAGIKYIWPGNDSPFTDNGGRLVVLLSMVAVAPMSAFRDMHSVRTPCL